MKPLSSLSSWIPSLLPLLLLLLHLLESELVASSWDQWWTYDGISGPDFWGLLNPKWSHCNKGRRQSPVDINPDLLLYDPGLSTITVNGNHIKGQLVNTGRGLKFKVSSNTSVIISGGPLSYDYSLNHLVLHYGREDDRGSEHTINGIPFPGELQLYFFNSQLYANWSEASDQPNGLAAIGVLIQVTHSDVGQEGNSQLKHIFHAIETIKFKGASTRVHKLAIDELLPTQRQYITYEGSLTQPACFETVQWVILNRPIYATPHQFSLLRNSIHLDGHGDNFRPSQPTNYRCIRTNIVHSGGGNTSKDALDNEIGFDQVNFNKKKLCSGKGFIVYKANVKAEDGML